MSIETTIPIPSCFLFGQIVKEMRIEKRLQQQDLATALGIEQSAYSKLERGVVAFNSLHLAKIEDGAGMEPVMLFERYEKVTADLKARGLAVESRRTKPAEIKKLSHLFFRLDIRGNHE